MNAKHTKGPWAFEEGDRDRAACSQVFKKGDKEFLIAHVICDSRNELARADDICNARLIAAAPDLLTACELLLKVRGGDPAADAEVRIAREAIAKAKGDSQPTPSALAASAVNSPED